MKVQLQPLRIPSGWTVSFNDGLYEVDPPGELVSEQDRSVFFKEDLLQLRHQRHNRVLDVGWYPSGDLATGQYVLTVYANDCLGPKLHSMATVNRVTLVAEIERLLVAIADGAL
ncbi:MAG: hypothetical protein V4719_08695 [Planctomycetota bacterium]